MEHIKLIVLDVDGTMTNGSVYIDSNGIEIKEFYIKDGAAILLAQKMNIDFMILTGRESKCVEYRAKELGIKYVFQGIKDKKRFLEEFILENNFLKSQLAYIGDDLNDLYAMRLVGIAACPSDAAEEIKKQSNIVLSKQGGNGVVREFIEILLKKRNEWDSAIERCFRE